jgi:plastocyanin
MQRFRLLGLYVAGLVAVIGLSVWGVSMRRAMFEVGTQQVLESDTEEQPARNAMSSLVKVNIENFAYEPKVLVVMAGSTVSWVNSDDAPHTVTSTASPPLFHSNTLDSGDKFSLEFKAAGTYEYFCKLHPYMTGKVVVK